MFTQLARMSAKVASSSVGTCMPLGTFVPGLVPVAVFTSSLASINALASAAASLDPDPTCVAESINGCSQRIHTPATVVSSFTTMYVLEVSDPHCPNAAIIASCPLFTVPDIPGLPPVATMYTSAVAEGHTYINPST